MRPWQSLRVLLTSVAVLIPDLSADVAGGSAPAALSAASTPGPQSAGTIILNDDSHARVYLVYRMSTVVAKDRQIQPAVELTAKVKLGSKSMVSTWSDFNGDGRQDLFLYYSPG